MVVAVANYQVLPDPSWFNLWFDVDSKQETGDAGDEALVRYLSSGAVELYVWDGSALVASPTTGVAGSFSGGVLTLSVSRVAINAPAAFDLLAIAARGQDLVGESLVAADYAPDRGRSSFAGPGTATFPDAGQDQDAAPDITSVRVSDAKDGWVSIAMTTPNYVVLPGQSAVVLSFDTDDNSKTGDDGAEVLVRSLGGVVELERWLNADGSWHGDDAPTRARTRNSGNVVTIDVHRSELGSSNRVGVSIIAADLNTSADLVNAVDVAPDDLGYYRYTYENAAVVRLTAGKVSVTPRRPTGGTTVRVSAPVRRSDTGRRATSGAVTCSVAADGQKLRATGRFVSGNPSCTFTIPKATRRVRGALTLRVSAARLVVPFAFSVG